MRVEAHYSKIKFRMNFRFCFLYTLFFFINFSIFAQGNQNKYVITHDDSLALEKVIVEKYYVSDTSDYNNKDASPLPKGSVTYRIFIQMKPNYKLQLVYGNQKHELFLATSTRFFNDKLAGGLTGFNIDTRGLNKGNVALDSWITMGACCRGYTGIPLSEDTTGFSFITNRPSLGKADGLIKGILPDFKVFNLDMNFFNNDSTATRFATSNGGWAAPGGVKRPHSQKPGINCATYNQWKIIVPDKCSNRNANRRLCAICCKKPGSFRNEI